MRRLVMAVSSLVVLAVAGGVAFVLIHTQPEAKRAEATMPATLVEVRPVTREDRPVTVSAMGTVIPAREVTLQPEVSGRVVELHPNLIEGGRVGEGEVLLRIDPRDYEAQVTHQRAKLAEVRLALALEEGQQTIARREWDLLREGVPAENAREDLTLRKPQLAQTRAAVASVEKALAQAEWNLARTALRVPIDAVVRTRNVELGQVVGSQSQVAALVGTGRFHVRATLPVDRLPWIDLPDANGDGGATARVVHRFGETGRAVRPGRVVRLLSDLETAGRMARLLVAVDHPLDPPASAGDPPPPPLLLGAYVHVEITGRALKNVVVLPRTALHLGDTVWILADAPEETAPSADPENTGTAVAGGTKKAGYVLAIRPVEVRWRSEETVLLGKGVEAGERIVTSRIPSPVEGMPLRLEDGKDAAATGETAAP